MLRVYLSFDVEVWCNSWTDLEARFPEAFQRYVYGRTSKGDFGLPYTLNVLNEHGLRGVFFVEPLFALRFGTKPLSEIIGLIKQAGQRVDLHLHTEWVDEALEPVLPGVTEKRQHLRYFSLEEQAVLIELGRRLVEAESGAPVTAFRAGSFGFDVNTLRALKQVGIGIDSSYNGTLMGPSSGLMPGVLINEPTEFEGVLEVPMSVYTDRPGHLRHAQICASSFKEIENLLWKSLEQGREAVVILSHNFELLDPGTMKPNMVVVNRFRKLCQFLEKNSDSFNTTDFSECKPAPVALQPDPIAGSSWMTALRYAEQAWSRFA